ncbi:hypothetical protein H5410_049953 [Solanum commersonii]|uniref:Reverse transcriptase domain-containing protein n=1 Tax=Solanum commersonii TaxID=4109 RepID=A0A9J5WWJ1_SOLCO|nr:hypothetical protein H5410_049953 [Solanum commersonii]
MLFVDDVVLIDETLDKTLESKKFRLNRTKTYAACSASSVTSITQGNREIDEDVTYRIGKRICEHLKREKIRNENIGKKVKMVSMETEMVQKCEKGDIRMS